MTAQREYGTVSKDVGVTNSDTEGESSKDTRILVRDLIRTDWVPGVWAD